MTTPAERARVDPRRVEPVPEQRARGRRRDGRRCPQRAATAAGHDDRRPSLSPSSRARQAFAEPASSRPQRRRTAHGECDEREQVADLARTGASHVLAWRPLPRCALLPADTSVNTVRPGRDSSSSSRPSAPPARARSRDRGRCPRRRRRRRGRSARTPAARARAGCPGPSSSTCEHRATVVASRPRCGPSCREACGASAFSTRSAADLQHPLLVRQDRDSPFGDEPRAGARVPRATGRNSSASSLGEPAPGRRLALDAQPAGVEPRQVEQVGRELRQPVDLLAHASRGTRVASPRRGPRRRAARGSRRARRAASAARARRWR